MSRYFHPLSAMYHSVCCQAHRETEPAMTITRIVLCTMGTRGDIAPFTALAAELVARGERVTILSNENWRPLALACGAQFVPIAAPDPTQSGRDDLAFF